MFYLRDDERLIIRANGENHIVFEIRFVNFDGENWIKTGGIVYTLMQIDLYYLGVDKSQKQKIKQLQIILDRLRQLLESDVHFKQRYQATQF